MPWPTSLYRLPRLHCRETVVSALARATQRFYVYVLVLPDGTPFYVGKGQRQRLFAHERESACPTEFSHKLNSIRAVIRDGGAIQYAIDLLTDDEGAAHTRERELIGLIGRRNQHDAGPLTNHTDGGEGCSGWSDEMRENHLAMLGRADCKDPIRAAANSFLEKLLPSQASKTIKPLSQFTPKPLAPINKPMGVTNRQAATLAASAVANRIVLRPGCRIPRRLLVGDIECAIENGCGGDILKSGLAQLAEDSVPRQEVFAVDANGVSEIVRRVGRQRLNDLGVVIVSTP